MPPLCWYLILPVFFISAHWTFDWCYLMMVLVCIFLIPIEIGPLRFSPPRTSYPYFILSFFFKMMLSRSVYIIWTLISWYITVLKIPLNCGIYFEWGYLFECKRSSRGKGKHTSHLWKVVIVGISYWSQEEGLRIQKLCSLSQWLYLTLTWGWDFERTWIFFLSLSVVSSSFIIREPSMNWGKNK